MVNDANKRKKYIFSYQMLFTMDLFTSHLGIQAVGITKYKCAEVWLVDWQLKMQNNIQLNDCPVEFVEGSV